MSSCITNKFFPYNSSTPHRNNIYIDLKFWFLSQMAYIGEIAALATAITWSGSALFFTSASHRIGSFSMSHYRMLFGIILLYLARLIVLQSPFLSGITSYEWLLLGLSGITGFFIADTFLFQCYVDLGPRLGALLFNLYPFVSAFIAWMILGEILPLLAWVGMIITISGTLWVLLEKKGALPGGKEGHFVRGVICALSAATVQAVSFTLAKPVMTEASGVDPLTATLMRALVGGSAYWLVSILRGRFKIVINKASDHKAISLIAMGAVIGPSLGVWLSMVAIKYSPIGIASTIMALMPITILPMTAIFYKEKISIRAVIGAMIACVGLAILVNS